MISANELRLDNWVYHIELCENVQIESISSDQVTIKDHVVWDGDIGLIVGIPLTEKILLKCGFERTVTNMSFGTKYIDYRLGQFVLFLLPTGFVEVEFYASHNTIEERGYINKVKHLHQLQNLFYSIVGEELKINLHSK